MAYFFERGCRMTGYSVIFSGAKSIPSYQFIAANTVGTPQNMSHQREKQANRIKFGMALILHEKL